MYRSLQRFHSIPAQMRYVQSGRSYVRLAYQIGMFVH